jgi:hypothetical protein
VASGRALPGRRSPARPTSRLRSARCMRRLATRSAPASSRLASATRMFCAAAWPIAPARPVRSRRHRDLRGGVRRAGARRSRTRTGSRGARQLRLVQLRAGVCAAGLADRKRRAARSPGGAEHARRQDRGSAGVVGGCDGRGEVGCGQGGRTRCCPQQNRSNVTGLLTDTLPAASIAFCTGIRAPPRIGWPGAGTRAQAVAATCLTRRFAVPSIRIDVLSPE